MKVIKEEYEIRCPGCRTLFQAKRSEIAFGRFGKTFFICPICKELKRPVHYYTSRQG